MCWREDKEDKEESSIVEVAKCCIGGWVAQRSRSCEYKYVDKENKVESWSSGGGKILCLPVVDLLAGLWDGDEKGVVKVATTDWLLT